VKYTSLKLKHKKRIKNGDKDLLCDSPFGNNLKALTNLKARIFFLILEHTNES
jgi:hypothetical protein